MGRRTLAKGQHCLPMYSPIAQGTFDRHVARTIDRTNRELQLVWAHALDGCLALTLNVTDGASGRPSEARKASSAAMPGWTASPLQQLDDR
jgi:hypothetical protein